MSSTNPTDNNNTPDNPYTAPIQSFLSIQSPSKADTQAAASHLISLVSSARYHDDALWEFWVAFFTEVWTPPPENCISLLSAIYAHPPTTPNRAEWSYCRETKKDGKLYWSDLPRFGLEWREQHDELQHYRDSSTTDRYLNFVKFSAGWIKLTGGDVGIDTVLVFLLSRDVLEEVHPEPRTPKKGCMSTEQVWALDVKLAGIWMRDGAEALWNMDQSDGLLQKFWGRALAMKTELWPRDDGLSRGRWELWESRLRALSVEGGRLDEETKEIVGEAVEVLEGLLGL